MSAWLLTREALADAARRRIAAELGFVVPPEHAVQHAEVVLRPQRQRVLFAQRTAGRGEGLQAERLGLVVPALSGVQVGQGLHGVQRVVVFLTEHTALAGQRLQ